MNQNNQAWRKIFDNIEFNDQYNVSLGTIEKVFVENKTNGWRIVLSLPEVLTLEVMEDLTNKVREYCLKEFKVKTVKFNISYLNFEEYSQKNCFSGELNKYFKRAIDVCSTVTKSVLVINQYDYEIRNKTIVIYVPTSAEVKIINTVLPLVKKYLETYGFGSVEFDVQETGEIYNIMDRRIAQQKVNEQINEAKSLEDYQMRKEFADSRKEQNSYTQRVSNKPVYTKISSLPTNNIGVDEFRQINGTNKVTVAGQIVKSGVRLIKTKDNREYNIFEGAVYDGTDTLLVKRFYSKKDSELFEKQIKVGLRAEITGNVQWDDFAHDVVIMADKLILGGEDASRHRFDYATDKRIELHAHSKMSVLDSILNTNEYVQQAKRYGHKALALTDHSNCHEFPEFFKLAKKAGIKPIAGLEGYYIDDIDEKVALTNEDIDLTNATFVIFDIETTGLNIRFHDIIELGGVKVKHGMILETFSEMIRPVKRPVSNYVTKLNGITQEMVEDGEDIKTALEKFVEFSKDCILVAHNARFDTDFVYAKMKEFNVDHQTLPCIDTIQIARILYAGKTKQFNLGAIGKYLKVEVEQQHRAVHDSRTLNNIFQKMLGDLEEINITNYNQLNSILEKGEAYKYEIPKHINMLVKNKVGLKNLYKIISESHTTYFQREARVVRSLLEKYRDGLLIGSGCVNGEIFRLALEKTYDKLIKKISFYDYIEVQPLCCYEYLFEESQEEGYLDYLKDTVKLIIKAADDAGVLVVATGDVHELISEDTKYRQIYLSVNRPNGGGPHELKKYKPIDMHFRNTTEMLEEFAFLGEDLAYKIVVTNTNKINDMIEEYPLFPSELFVPRDDFLDKYGVPSMKGAVQELSYQTAHEIYGENLPEYVEKRIKRELDAIIGNGYHSVYYISHLLIKKSNEAGYIVGSRGSVGSSFVATMMKITEVNPLKPHYVCPKCKFSAFKFTSKEQEMYPQEHVPSHIKEALNKAGVGMDLEEMVCPVCGEKLNREGVDIEFETFLGFNGDKVPDIDLNFSGEYQPIAHAFCQTMFGIDNAFRAGTVSTVMDKTAFAYVRDFYGDTFVRQAEKERIASFIAGAKKTTGQHPGGIVVVPDTIEYTDVFPVQYPPVSDNDEFAEAKWRTSHYDYHSFEDNLLKLDILGHDDPTILKTLISYVHKYPEEFPFNTIEGIPCTDKDVLSLFSSKDALKLLDDDEDNLSSGTIGMPEFGTQFVRGMLNTIKPKTYNDIIKISGLSHGTDVWSNNNEDLFLGRLPQFPQVPLKDAIGCRDDIMNYLLSMDLPPKSAFDIMEHVRKGKGLQSDEEKLMREHNVPEWYIYSCKKIKYMFPKAHATAYVIMALRIGWFKVHRPIYYYATYFSKRAKELDAEVFANGKNAIRNKIHEIQDKMKNARKEVTNKEEDLLNELKIAYEMVLRGYKFKQIDLEKSEAVDFVIDEEKKALYLPFVAIPSLGDVVAKSIVAAREKAAFTSKKDFELRTSVNKTQFAKLYTLGVFDKLPDEDTLL